jgi:hypothetical protein
MQNSNPHTPQRESALKLATNLKANGFIVNYYFREIEKPFADDNTLYQLTVSLQAVSCVLLLLLVLFFSSSSSFSLHSHL